MSTNHYPKLDESQLKIVKRLMDATPGYLDDPACPYSAETKEILSQKGKAGETKIDPAAVLTAAYEDVDFKDMTDDSLLEEINNIYNQLKRSGQTIGNVDDTSEASTKNAYFRLSISLMKDVVSLRERLTNAMNITKFQEAVLTACEEILDVDARNQFLERLKRAGEQ